MYWTDGTPSKKVKLGEAEYDYLSDEEVEARRNKFTVKGKDGHEGRPGFGYLLNFLEGLPRVRSLSKKKKKMIFSSSEHRTMALNFFHTQSSNQAKTLILLILFFMIRTCCLFSV